MKKLFVFGVVATLFLSLTSCEKETSKNYYPGTNLKGVKVGGVIWAPVNCGYDETHPYGLMYQWGRKSGQGFDGEIPSPEFTNVRPSTVAGVVSATYDNKYIYGSTVWTSQTPKADDDWFTTYNPCPDGWRVPTKTEFDALVASGFVWTTTGGPASNQKGMLFADGKVFLPAAGGRNYTTMESYGRGNNGEYWVSTPTPTNAQCAYRFGFAQGTTTSFGGSLVYRAAGGSVRCVEK